MAGEPRPTVPPPFSKQPPRRDDDDEVRFTSWDAPLVPADQK